MSDDVGTTKRKPLTIEDLRRHLTYDEWSGQFTRALSLNRHKKGEVAGKKDTNGHIQIFVNGRYYLAHRCAWLWSYGVWPDHDIDHINGDRSDNRLANLRKATRSQNCSNSKLRADNNIGLKGVSIQKGRYRAQIQVKGKKQFLGMFSTPEEAHEAYCKAAQSLHGEFARTA